MGLNEWVREREFEREKLPRGARAYTKELSPMSRLVVLVAKEQHMPGGRVGWHLSISHRTKDGPGRYPTWDEIVEARYRFMPGGINVAMMLPPREQYVNLHETCFHLWEVDADPGQEVSFE